MDKIKKAFYGQEFDASRAVLYHEHRILFWSALLKISELLEFLLSAAAFAALWAKVPRIAMVVTLISTALSGLVLCFHASTRLKNNINQRNLFYDHLKLFPTEDAKKTADLLDKILANRKDIQKNDDTRFPCLSVRCHNELCLARGIDDFYHLTFFQKHIGSILPIPYDKSNHSA